MVGVQAARELFYREDFPTIKVGKNFKVMKSAFTSCAGNGECDKVLNNDVYLKNSLKILILPTIL